jgi:choline dehydrogenase-like flavoprotein
LGAVFTEALEPAPLPQPYWVGHSNSLADRLGLPSGWTESSELLDAFTGNHVLEGSQLRASVYSGHQFGVWAGQLGDGRACSLGELAGLEVQLKGAGPTPYSRRGDGRAVLRSSIREFLCSEAMHGLGIRNVDLITHAMAREVITDKEGKAVGISYVNTLDKQEYQVNAKVVILGASTCETARLLLNSKSTKHPNGLANSSGIIGRYLHDSTGAALGGVIPSLFGRKRYNEDGVGGMHVYTPWWLDNKKLDFPRGYHIEYWGGMSQPNYGFGMGQQGLNGQFKVNGKTKEAGGYGESLKEDVRFFYGASVGMGGRGEAVPRYDNYCEIDSNVVDKYGIPVLKFNVKNSEYEINQAKHMKETFKEIMHEMGAVITWGGEDDASNNYGLSNPGNIIHEAGTVRMGKDKKTAPLNEWGQAHDCKNLFCVDGSVFTSQADKNITWTILALSMRTSEYILDQLQKQNLK